MTRENGPLKKTRSRRIGLSFRLRTMLFLVAAVAAALGWFDWWKRRQAVNELLSRVPVSVFLRYSTTYPDSDPTRDPGGTFKVATRRVRELKQEKKAVSLLRLKLREVLKNRDEKGMRGALAALMGLGPEVAAAGPEVLAIVKITATAEEGPERFTQARMLAVHVLGIVADTDRSFLDSLFDAAFLPDPSPRRVINESAAHELAPFVKQSDFTAPRLLAALDVSLNQSDRGSNKFDARSVAILHLFSHVPPTIENLRTVLPRLKSIVKDETSTHQVRSAALWSIANLYHMQNDPIVLVELSSYLEEVESYWDEIFPPREFQALRINIREHEKSMGRGPSSSPLVQSDRKVGGVPTRDTTRPPDSRVRP